MSQFFTAPPTYQPVVDESGIVDLKWMIFFNSLFTGDPGQGGWTPTFTSLAQTGTPTISGKTFQLSQSLVMFSVTVTPATDTTSTAGTTYINNFPFVAQSDGICFAVSGNLGSAAGMVAASSNRIYVPAWTTVTVPLTIFGIVEAK